MPRYFVQWDFGRVTEDGFREVAERAKASGSEHFPEIVWKQSHVVSGNDGTINAFCVYEAPTADLLREHVEHVEHVNGMELERILEIVGELAHDEIAGDVTSDQVEI